MKKVRVCLCIIVVIACGIIGGSRYFFGIALNSKVTATDEENSYVDDWASVSSGNGI